MPAQIAFDKGWIQRISRHQMPPGGLVDAINVTPNEFGALQTRLGHALISTTAQADVHSLATLYTPEGTRVRYQGAGTKLYRDFAEILAGLDGSPIDFASLRGFGEQTEYMFFANGQDALRVKDNGVSLTRWGIAPPTAAPSAVAGAIKTQTIDTFNSATVDTDYTPTGCTLSRDTVIKQEGASALGMAVPADGVGLAKKAIAALDLTTFSGGGVATDDDVIRLWVYVQGLANLEGLQVALNFSAGTQFIDGFFISNVDLRQFIPSDGVYSEIRIPRNGFLRAGAAAGDWNAINGIMFVGITNVGGSVTLKWDDLRLEGGYRIGDGVEPGTYRYKQAFIRKATIAGHDGKYVNGSTTYTDQTGGTLDLTTTTNNDGHLVAGETPFAEVVYTVSQATSGGTPVYECAYWAGSWVTFTPDEQPDFSTTGAHRIRLGFPAGPWHKETPAGMTFNGIADTVKYWLRIRATTAPTITAGQASSVKVYDSVVSARGNGSDFSSVVTAYKQPITVTVSNPLVAGADLDAQVTHVEVYRTVANDTDDDHAASLLEGDVPAGSATFVSSAADAALGEILPFDNDRPLAFTAVMEHQARIFGLIGNRLYFSKAGFPESFPPLNYVEVSTLGDPPQQLRQYDGVPYVWTQSRIYQILGADETTYFPRQIQCPTGLGAKKSVERGERGIYFLGRDGNLWRLQGSQALNISDEGHYALFHSTTQNGISPLNQAARSTCVGAWYNQRFYLSYPSGAASTPNALVFIDERTDTWYRDSRAFRCLHYDRIGNALVGSSGTNGKVWQLDSGNTDEGADIVITVQTRDEDEGQPEHDKELVQCTVDAVTGVVLLTVQAVVDYANTGTTLGTLTSALRQQTPLGTAVGTSLKGKAIGYRLMATGGIVTLYRLIPHVIVYPAVLASYRSLPLDLDYPGPKFLESLHLDIDRQSGTLTVVIYADGAVVQTTNYATGGRQLLQVVQSPLSGTIFQYRSEERRVGKECRL